MEAWRQWLLGREKNHVSRNENRIDLTPTGLLMEGHSAQISIYFAYFTSEAFETGRKMSDIRIFSTVKTGRHCFLGLAGHYGFFSKPAFGSVPIQVRTSTWSIYCRGIQQICRLTCGNNQQALAVVREVFENDRIRKNISPAQLL